MKSAPKQSSQSSPQSKPIVKERSGRWRVCGLSDHINDTFADSLEDWYKLFSFGAKELEEDIRFSFNTDRSLTKMPKSRKSKFRKPKSRTGLGRTSKQFVLSNVYTHIQYLTPLYIIHLLFDLWLLSCQVYIVLSV